MKSRYAEKRTRSANAPVISAGVMIANLSWNSAKSMQRDRRRQIRVRRAADAVEHEEGPRIADQAADAVAEGEAEADDAPRARLMTPRAMKLCSMVETTFLKPTMPP